MHYRVISLSNNKILQPKEGFDFVMFDDGSVGQSNEDTEEFQSIGEPYVVEIAFVQDDNLNWIYEHAVVNG